MMKSIFTRTLTPVLGLLLLLFAACESPLAVEDASDEVFFEEVSLTDLSAVLADELSLSSESQQRVGDLMSRHTPHEKEPGRLWYVAAELQQELSEEEKTRLFDLAERLKERGVRSGGPGGPGGQGGPGLRRGGPGGGPGGEPAFADLLTDEQKAAMQTIREAYRPQIEALFAQYQDGEITREDLEEQLHALHEAMRAEIDALLTDEQRAEIAQRQEARQAEMEAKREAARAAMAEALALTEEQQAALDGLSAQRDADRDVLAEQLEQGNIDREAFREAMDALRATFDEAFTALLDETQQEIKAIHDALMIVRGHHGQKGRPGGPGGRRPGNGGQGG